jgi:hypothetical protein
MPVTTDEKKLVAQVLCSIIERMPENQIPFFIPEKPLGQDAVNIEKLFNRLLKLFTVTERPD